MTSHPTIQEAIEKGIEEFNDKFKCINFERLGCDNLGNIPVQVGEGEWEAEQCQYCFERLFKYREFIRTTYTERLLSAVEREIEGMIKEKIQMSELLADEYGEGNDLDSGCDPKEMLNHVLSAKAVLESLLTDIQPLIKLKE